MNTNSEPPATTARLMSIGSQTGNPEVTAVAP